MAATNSPFTFSVNASGGPNAAYKPAKPVLTYPTLNGGERVTIAHNGTSGQRPWLVWSDSGGPALKTITYRLQVSRSSDMTNLVYDKADLSTLGHQLTSDFYLDGEPYYVRIEASDSNGNATTSDVFSWRYQGPAVKYALKIRMPAMEVLRFESTPGSGKDGLCGWRSLLHPGQLQA